MKAKYVIVGGSAIVFSPAIQHSEMVKYGQKCDRAGFVTFYTQKDKYGDDIIKADCYGESVSLGIKSREAEDSAIVTRQLTNPMF